MVAFLLAGLEWSSNAVPFSSVVLSHLRFIWGVGRCAAIFNDRWFQLEWPSQWSDTNIAPKELVPIVVAVALWGPQWAGQKICSRCDSIAVVCAINKRSARDPVFSRLLCILCMLCAVYDITLVACHLPGLQNASADALSLEK